MPKKSLQNYFLVISCFSIRW